ncbi:RteC domain-containing protein [Pedobacter antarcticus]|uniref:RteC domain-containing protein n=1 Tax=Pedobacter antarcticus TaxID=34086 RepID=UPI000882FC56|nr:RteC domain-containing protein [Pedobacter antarcticus]SDL85290.1 RteC protein [Pedobacter antarcticus]
MRKNTFKILFRDLKNRLKLISGHELNLIEKFNEVIGLIAAFHKELNDHVRKIPFKDKFDEIYYHKFERPDYMAIKIYYTLLFKFQCSLPVAVPELRKSCYLEKLKELDNWFRDHRFLYDYYRMGYTDLDEVLFIRGAEVTLPYLQDIPELDKTISTPGDYLFSLFIAYEKLQEYLLTELLKLDQHNPEFSAITSPKKSLDWTGEIINLVELGYAIWLSGQLGSGKTGLQEIFNWLEASFGVEVGIPANRFREIKRRKRLSRTRFIDFCKTGLLNYMDDDDAFHPDDEKDKHRFN